MFKLFGCPRQARLCRNSQQSFLILPFFSCSFCFSKPLPPFLLSSTTDISFKLLQPAFSEISTFLESYLFTILTVGIVFSATLSLLFFVLFMNCFINTLFFLSSLEPYYISMYHKIWIYHWGLITAYRIGWLTDNL